jgi:hypothetical protein
MHFEHDKRRLVCYDTLEIIITVFTGSFIKNKAYRQSSLSIVVGVLLTLY